MGKVLHASYSGYFPFCIQKELPSTSIVESKYSGSASSINLMMAIYWRVKEWQISYQSNLQSGFVVNASGIYGFDADTEEELVCAPQFIEKSFSSDIGFFEEHSFSILSLFSNLYYAITSTDNNLSFRYAFETLYFGANDGTEGGFIYSGHIASELGPEAIEETIPVPIADVGIAPFKITKMPDIDNYYAVWEIRPVNYWSYGGLYDEITGLPT